MTVFEKFQSKNIDELIEWLDEYCVFDYAPWMKWYDETYCKNCEPEIRDRTEYAWCELNDNKCKYFQDMDRLPNNKQVIRLWLERESEG